MILALRGSRLLVAVAATLLLLTAIALPALPFLHGLNDDPCNASAASGEGTARQIGAARALATSPHCAICHWWQAAGRSGGPHSVILTQLADFGLVERPPSRIALLVVSNRPARAPPAA
jgi:hypothetical protein